MKGSKGDNKRISVKNNLIKLKESLKIKVRKINAKKFSLSKDRIKKFMTPNLNKEFFNMRNGIIAIAAIVFLVFSIAQYNKGQKDLDNEFVTQAFNVKLGDRELGIVRDKYQVIQIYNSVKDNLSKEKGFEIAINEELSFEEIEISDENIEFMDEFTIEEKIWSGVTYNAVGYAININGEDISYLASEELANKVLEEIKKPYIEMAEENGSKIEDIKIVEDVKIIEKEVPISKIEDFDKVLAIIQRGTDEEKVHVVEEGENYWVIAHKYNITVEELEKANPGKDSVLIHPGDELSLIVPKPYLTVATYEEVTYIADIPFETEYEYSSALYNDQQSIRKKGIPGETEIVAKVEKHNGIEVAKEILKETILSNPITQIVVKGTKEPPPKKGTGTFIMPTRGTLTSRFGQRWGRLHKGIDLAANTGTAIKAADGGTVTYAGWKGTYGYMVEIDHGGNFKTRYAHCSKIYVKQGDKVYQGQTIAAVGNTGNSTGPHLHFEVLKNGVPQDPYNYIGKSY